jgi:hypothetical protein
MGVEEERKMSDDCCTTYLIFDKYKECGCVGCVGALILIGVAKECNGEELQNKSYALRIVENYQKNISPDLHRHLGKEKICKFTPSCSNYAKEAIEKHGSVKGIYIAAKRLARCNPWSKGGYDPVASYHNHKEGKK